MALPPTPGTAAGGRDVEARLTKAGALGDERDRVEISWST